MDGYFAVDHIHNAFGVAAAVNPKRRMLETTALAFPLRFGMHAEKALPAARAARRQPQARPQDALPLVDAAAGFGWHTGRLLALCEAAREQTFSSKAQQTILVRHRHACRWRLRCGRLSCTPALSKLKVIF